ncbi:MAG TPA: NADH-quinone oxidoreductase subunit N [Cyclobacteriaceae bacterium]|nr:NADH-quinone oxidoreductase subunit N [Cyclobacteriaceae bacterium]
MNALYILCGLGVLSLVAEIVSIKRGLLFFLTVGIAVAAGVAVMDWNSTQSYFSDMVVFDNFALAFTILICILTVFWFWMSRSYFHNETHVTDQAALVLFAVVGAIVLTAYNNMAMLFLGVEILSLSLYVLAGSKRENLFSNEAAFKYFLMGSFATGFLLMGIALIYGASGLFHIDRIAAFAASNTGNLPGFFYAGIVMIMIGMAFKISAVPFHFWAPDVYEGSPTAVTAFMSAIVKVAAFAAFTRMFAFCFASSYTSWLIILQVIMILTLVIANITAVVQTNVKRILAYSSVAHAGYVLLALVSTGNSAGVILYYLAAYASASLLAFCVLIEHENQTGDLSIKSFNGYFKANPFLSVALIIALLSLAGIPPLAGFFGKYFVFSLALNQGYVGLVVLAILTSLAGVYYYFKIIVALFSDPEEARVIPLSASTRFLLWILFLVTVGLGVFPDLVNVL